MRRGSAGAIIRDGKLYLVSGIINGHTDGWVKWFTSYDFKTGQWAFLPEAPHARDHFEAALVNNKIYAVGGRRSSAVTNQVFDLTVPEIDVYDFTSGKWSTLPPSANLAVPRAGGAYAVVGANLIFLGGESMAHQASHGEVDMLDTKTGQWRSLPPMQDARHGTEAILYNNSLYICAGCGERGGSPLLDSMEMLK